MKVLLAIFFSACILNSSHSYATCVDDEALRKINDRELEYMLGRVPPAFSQAFDDMQLYYQHAIADVQACTVTVTVTFPETHIQEAEAELNSDISKKILLAAQGYSLPEKSTISATYSINAKTLSANPPEILQSGALGKLRASVEMMYALITQRRLNTLAKKPISEWSDHAVEKNINTCKTTLKNANNCACLVKFYAGFVTPRDYENLLYSQSNPYAFASIKNAFITDLAQKSTQHCSQ
jgi:hypothetical protein